MYIFYFQFTDALHKLLWNATNSIETHETFVIVSVGNFPVFPGPRSTYNKCVRQLACLFLHLNLLFVPYFQWLLAITVIWRFFSLKALSFFLRNLPFDHEFGVGNAAVSVQIHFSEGPFIYYVSTWPEGGSKNCPYCLFSVHKICLHRGWGRGSKKPQIVLT